MKLYFEKLMDEYYDGSFDSKLEDRWKPIWDEFLDSYRRYIMYLKNVTLLEVKDDHITFKFGPYSKTDYYVASGECSIYDDGNVDWTLDSFVDGYGNLFDIGLSGTSSDMYEFFNDLNDECEAITKGQRRWYKLVGKVQ